MICSHTHKIYGFQINVLQKVKMTKKMGINLGYAIKNNYESMCGINIDTP